MDVYLGKGAEAAVFRATLSVRAQRKMSVHIRFKYRQRPAINLLTCG